jgi:hypothetical protein
LAIQVLAWDRHEKCGRVKPVNICHCKYTIDASNSCYSLCSLSYLQI